VNGENHYCMAEMRAERQAREQIKRGYRYTQVNCCYGLHGTIEFRVLPMFNNCAVSRDAVAKLLEIIEQFVSAELGGGAQPARGVWALLVREGDGSEIVVKSVLHRPMAWREGKRRGVEQPSSTAWRPGTDGKMYRIRFMPAMPVAAATGDVLVAEAEGVVEELDLPREMEVL
jgi:hypothetical protein